MTTPYRIVHVHGEGTRAGWEWFLLVLFAALIAFGFIAAWLWFRRERYDGLSRMDDEHLDRWGQVYGLHRLPGENYDRYRARISSFIRRRR